MSEEPACRGQDPELFFPDARHEGARAKTKIAKSICAGCPIRAACLEENLDIPYGIWGGLTQREREKLRYATGVRVRNMSTAPTELQIMAQRERRQREQQELLALSA